MPARRDPLPSLPLFLLGLAAIVVVELANVVASGAVRGEGLTLVIAPPWRGGAEAVVLAAGGRLIGPTQAPLSALADGATRQALKEAGAWAVFDPAALPIFCQTATEG